MRVQNNSAAHLCEYHQTPRLEHSSFAGWKLAVGNDCESWALLLSDALFSIHTVGLRVRAQDAGLRFGRGLLAQSHVLAGNQKSAPNSPFTLTHHFDAAFTSTHPERE